MHTKAILGIILAIGVTVAVPFVGMQQAQAVTRPELQCINAIGRSDGHTQCLEHVP